MKCKPRSYHGNEGVVRLTHLDRENGVNVEISFCIDVCKVRFVFCTFVDATLTWWKDHANTICISSGNAMSWGDLKQLLIDQYFPQDEMYKLEQELWDLTVKDADIETYSNQFNELATLCPSIVTPVYKQVERSIWVLV